MIETPAGVREDNGLLCGLSFSVFQNGPEIVIAAARRALAPDAMSRFGALSTLATAWQTGVRR